MSDIPFTAKDVTTCQAIANTIRYGTWGFSGEPEASAAYIEELATRLQGQLTLRTTPLFGPSDVALCRHVDLNNPECTEADFAPYHDLADRIQQYIDPMTSPLPGKGL